MVESLTTPHRKNLIEIIRRRLIESRRDAISHNIRIAREEHTRGEITISTVDDLMAEIKTF
uniref:Uncharacterized protein n=1 Tax=Candidatus Kentrum sp. FW TaxID=2126338 RepID=A0A450S2C0_9GAMM|nr:MAG: hypothetical protein BECKFW1821A_GA0114235_10118 [Candidatus Kentron sp. FW]VFJ46557.1 MAG: hypothetical protein BECKFW1821B_GA0114236_100111 [Candidatus Kentron sp. FW]